MKLSETRVGRVLRRPARVDLALALLLAALAQLQVWTVADIPEPRALTAASALLVTLPLAFRRRAPLATLAVVMVGFALPTAYAETSLQGPALLAAVLVSLYSAAAFGVQRQPHIGLAVAIGGIALHELRAGIERQEFWNAAFFWLLTAVAWLVGRYVQRHREARSLADRTVRLEREREEHVREAVAEERARIARELHDIVSHSVSVMVVQAEAAEEVLPTQPDRAAAPLGKIQHTGREALADMRRMLGVLRESGSRPGLSPAPGIGRIEELLQQVRDAGLQVELKIEGRSRRLAPGLDLTAYRIVQEALTNVRKHAGPARAEVVVRYGEHTVEIEVTDDGRGAAGERGAGQGLIGMRERVRLFGGELHVGPQHDRGYQVRASLPLS